MESDSLMSGSSSELDPDNLPAPFIQLGPVEWCLHGLQARAANSLKHGNDRYWVTYCPSNGIHNPSIFRIALMDSRPVQGYIITARIYNTETVTC